MSILLCTREVGASKRSQWPARDAHTATALRSERRVAGQQQQHGAHWPRLAGALPPVCNISMYPNTAPHKKRARPRSWSVGPPRQEEWGADARLPTGRHPD